MKIRISQVVEAKLLIVKAKVRYWTDAKVNGQPDTENGDNIPCKVGNVWLLRIDIDRGKILNWTYGKKAEVHYKVCDELYYQIQDEFGKIILSSDYVYVPETLSPKRPGHGDYMHMDIDEEGQIDKWKFDPNDFENLEQI